MTASTCNRSFIRRSSHPLTPFFGGPTHREWRARNRGGVTRPLFNRVHDAAVRDVQCTHDDVSNTACNSVNCSNVSESRNANPSPLSPLRKSVYDSPDIGEIATFCFTRKTRCLILSPSDQPIHSPSEGCHRHPSAVSDLSSAEHRQVRRFAPDANLYLPRLSPDVHDSTKAAKASRVFAPFRVRPFGVTASMSRCLAVGVCSVIKDLAGV